MRNAMVMPMVFVITILISMLIASYMRMTSVHLSKEYYKNLAEVRGYWGAYGAKELDISKNYRYTQYDINISKNADEYNWTLTIPSGKDSGITNDNLYNRKIKVLGGSDANSTDIIQYSL
jgi:hypothetical protein